MIIQLFSLQNLSDDLPLDARMRQMDRF